MVASERNDKIRRNKATKFNVIMKLDAVFVSGVQGDLFWSRYSMFYDYFKTGHVLPEDAESLWKNHFNYSRYSGTIMRRYLNLV